MSFPRRRKSLLFVCLCFLLACSSQSNKKIPEDVLPEESMEKILTDMHIAEGFLTARPASIDSLKQLGVSYRDEVYRKHNTTHEQFLSSYDYYNHHPVLLDSIYSKVITKLSELEVEWRK